MKNNRYTCSLRSCLIVICSFMFFVNIDAQRLQHRQSGSRGGQSSNRPVNNRPATTLPSNNRPSRSTNSGVGNRQNSNNKSVNINSNNKTSNIVVVRPQNNGGRQANNNGRPSNNGGRPNNNRPPSNQPAHRPHPTPPSHHNPGPRPRPVPPPRPPYVWGGMHIYYSNPYYYFPFRPYRWHGWYPWGYVVTTMVQTAIIVSVINDAGQEQDYNYDDGNFYLKTEEGFVAVAPPIGAVVPSVPSDAEKVKNGTDTYYYYGATFYQKTPQGYEVVIPTAGTVVSHLPEGADEVKVGDRTYVMFDNIYYQPIQVNGKNLYEIVEFTEE